MLVLNRNETNTKLNLDRFRLVIGNSTSGKEVVTGEKIDLTSELNLEKAGPSIIEIDR